MEIDGMRSRCSFFEVGRPPRACASSVLVLVLALQCALKWGCTHNSAPEPPRAQAAEDDPAPPAKAVEPATEPQAPPAPAAEPAPKPAQETASVPDDAIVYAELSNKFQRIPTDSKDAKIPRAEWQRRVEELLPRCHAYLEQYRTGANVPEVCAMTAKLLTMYNQHREKLPVEAWRVGDAGAYFLMVDGIIARGLASNPTPEVRISLEKGRGEVYYFSKQLERARDHYRRLVDEFPGDGGRDTSWMAYLRVLKELGQEANVVASATEFLAAYPRSEYLPDVVGLLANTHLQTGAMGASRAVWDRYAAVLKDGAEGRPVDIAGEKYMFPARTRNDFGAQAEQVDFWRGFIAWVEGEIESARGHYDACIAYLEQRQVAGTITKPGEVFLQRATRERSFLEQQQGRPGADLTGLEWAGPTSIDVAAARAKGQVVALLFAGQDWTRSRPIAHLLETYHQQSDALGIRCAWVANPKGKRDLPQQKLSLEATKKEIGIAFPAGFDAGDRYPIFSAYNCAVGGGTLVLLDRSGNCAWYKMDPRGPDLVVAGFVIDRLLAEPTPSGAK